MAQHEELIKRCIQLAEQALAAGELPFGSVVVQGDLVIAEAYNTTIQTNDVTNHAEVLVLKQAQAKLGKDLSDCTIYSNCEPCAMCAFLIRELHVGTVVFGTKSPIMGGYSRWKILQDEKLETLSRFYTTPPEIIAGLLKDETDLLLGVG